VLPAVCGIGVAAVAGWMLAGGVPPSAESPSRVPVHVDSSPVGAQVQIDGRRYGKTPADLRLSPGQHRLSLQHPDALDDQQTLQVAETGATVDVGMWRRRPDVVVLRPVYPGASLLDARFLNDGEVALLVGLPVQTGAPSASRQLWRLDPAIGHLL
jgi:hypothetical protein